MLDVIIIIVGIIITAILLMFIVYSKFDSITHTNTEDKAKVFRRLAYQMFCRRRRRRVQLRYRLDVFKIT